MYVRNILIADRSNGSIQPSIFNHLSSTWDREGAVGSRVIGFAAFNEEAGIRRDDAYWISIRSPGGILFQWGDTDLR